MPGYSNIQASFVCNFRLVNSNLSISLSQIAPILNCRHQGYISANLFA